MRIVIMGVSGCGKSSVGTALAEALGVGYMDGDDLHPAENIAKMTAGIPLQDEDRWDWLDKVGDALENTPDLRIVGCSALKRVYRDRIRARVSSPVMFVHLAGSRELIARRLSGRAGHFMPSALLDSQFATLEPPTSDERCITIGIEAELADMIPAIIAGLEETAS